MPLHRIIVNKHVIRANEKTGACMPPLSLHVAGRPALYGHEVSIIGPSRVVYRPEKPLKCGASVWIECQQATIKI